MGTSDQEGAEARVPVDPTPEPPTPRLVHAVGSRRAVLDVVVQIVGRFGNLVLGIVATALLARGLGEAQFGVWSTILVVPSLLAYFTDLGFQQVAVRLATADDDPLWLGALVTAKAALAVPTVMLCAAVFVAIGARGEMLAAGLIVSLQALLAVPSALNSVFQVRVRNDLTIAAITANSVLWTLSVWLLTRADAGLVALAVALVGWLTLTTGLQAVYALRVAHIPMAHSWRRWRPLARTAIPLSIGTLLIFAYARIDGLIVYKAAGAVDAGLYGAAYRVLEQSAFIPLSLTMTLMPILTRMWPGDRSRARRLLQTTLELLAMASFFALAFTIVAGRDIILLLYDEPFARAAEALPILMGAFVLICVGYAFGIYTLVLDLTRRFALYAFVALVVNVAANLALVPRYGFVAAAWVTVATEMVVTGLIGRDILRCLEMRLALGRLARIALAATVAGVAVALLRDATGLGVVWLLLIGAGTHAAGLVVTRALTATELRAVLRRDPSLAM